MEKIIQIASSIKLMGSIIDTTHYSCFKDQDNKQKVNSENLGLNQDLLVSDDAVIMECPSDGDC
jgi:hypothetical protein